MRSASPPAGLPPPTPPTSRAARARSAAPACASCAPSSTGGTRRRRSSWCWARSSPCRGAGRAIRRIIIRSRRSTTTASPIRAASAMPARVGDEHMGRFVREALAGEGVDVSHLGTDPRRLTGLVVLGVRDREQFPLIFFREDCADMALDAADVDAGFIASAKAVLVTGTHLSRPGPAAACRRAVDLARAAGRKVIFDIDYRPGLWGLTGPGRGGDRYVAAPRG